MRRSLRAGDDLAEIIIRAIADETERDPMELSPIAETIDPDALDSLFLRSSTEAPVKLTLLYEGCRVTIEPDVVTVEQVPEA